MGTSRDIAIPLEHIAAELAAIPFASTAAFELSLISFDPTCNGVTEKLWRTAERELVTAFPSFTVDEFVALRDWLWFKNEGKDAPVTLVEYLRELAYSTLDFGGNTYSPKLPPWAEQSAYNMDEGAPDARARRFWRWVSFALPPDILIAARGESKAVTAEIELISPILARMLFDGSYTEPHLHIGAAISFDLLWVSLQHVVARPERVSPADFQSPGADANEGLDFLYLLVHAALTRYVLATYLDERKQMPALTSFTEYLRNIVEPLLSGRNAPSTGEELTWQALERLTQLGDHATISQLNNVYRLRVGMHDDPHAWRVLSMMLQNLAKGYVGRGGLSYDVSLRDAQEVYARLTRIRERWPIFPTTPREGLQADPIGRMFVSAGRDLETSEIGFIREALSYLENTGKHDEEFARLFWQTQRIKTRFYRHVVQRPMTPGLQWFVRFFRRLRPARGSAGIELLVYEAARTSGMGYGLRALEVRTSPASTPTDLISVVEAFRSAFDILQRVDDGVPPENDTDWRLPRREQKARDQARLVAKWIDAKKDARRTEFGLILHFTRERGGGWDEGKPSALGMNTHADPRRKDNLNLRFSAYYRKKRQEALSLATVLRRHPRSLRIIRALDVCTDELGIPTWVFAPLCRHVRDVSRATSDYLRRAFDENIAPLRLTVHAGEEFVHLLGGLRRVDEALTYLELAQGDRIGHGMVLGVHPGEWCRRAGAVALSRLERLLDLAWEWRFATNNSIPISANRLQYVIDQIERLSHDIFREFAHPPQVARFLELLNDPRYLRCVGFPNGPVPEYDDFLAAVRGIDAKVSDSGTTARDDIKRVWRDLPPNPSDETRDVASALTSLYRRIESSHASHGEEPWRLLYRYFTDVRTFSEGQKLILIDPAAEETSLFDLQVALRRKIGAKGVTVEINPSSNLLIGNLSDLRNHPLWRLKPPLRDQSLGDIALCIGSDDPITFMTGTRQEYQLVYDTLTLAGMSDTDARAWLSDCQRAGLESRFTAGRAIDFSYESIWEPMDVDLSHLMPLR